MPSYVGGCFKERTLFESSSAVSADDTSKYYVLIPRNMPAGISSSKLEVASIEQ